MNRPTIADLRALKGQRQLTMLRVETLEAAGAFAAEIEVVPSEVAAAISRRTSNFAAEYDRL